MKAFFVLAILITLGVSTFTTTTSCSCTQLLSQGDCIKQAALGCAWDSKTSTCAKDTSTPVTPTITYATYCEQFNQTDCPLKSGCQWLTTKCSHFTGCTAFAKTTDPDCQAISNRCITDGVHCVEKATCSSYLKQLPCVVSASGSLCYWDTTATPNVCIDATKCEHLPTTLLTDADCRAKISTCTAKTGGGCQDSGNNCADQQTQLQCFWNKLKTQSCFWNGTACVDRTCANSLTTYTTDDACKTYLASCTTKSGGGCVTRAACSAATNQESCKTNSSGALCYWNSANTCVDKNCAAAPTTYTTNKQCSDFVTGCITKKDGGCKSNGTCSVADIESACVTNSSGGACIWSSNNTCVDKQCSTAPASNTTHDLCAAFMPSCTVNSTNNGCRVRSCDNASTDYDTNDKCNTYLAGCITKTGGGCIVNTTCSAIGSLEKACVKDAAGNACIFDSNCKDKTCANAPSTNTTHVLCQTYMNTCTVNSANNGCVDMTCENIQSSDNCSKDKSNNVCVWKGTCYKKQCKQAASSLTSYSDCTGFMTSCTVDNDGNGCMDKPPQCSGILTSAGCVVNSAGGVCAWYSNKCQDQTCATAPSTTATTSDCNTYRSGCIVNNNTNGCIDPTTTTCSARTLADNCNASNGPVCLWNPTASPSCMAKSCATASQTSITTTNGYISAAFTNSSCSTYLTGCIVNNDSTGCIAKATSCSSYSSTNCTQGLANGGACYLNSDNTCVDKQCQLIKQATHTDCQTAYDSCTYGNGTVCAAKQASCGGYTQNQCHKTSGGKNCVWSGGACRDAICSDAANSANFDTHNECNTYVGTCTVIDRVSTTGCVSLSTNCSDYTIEAQCHKNVGGSACYWNYDQCVQDGTLTCATIRLATYNLTNCSAVIATCKANGDSTACVDASCSDFTSNCTNFGATCVANNAANACFVRPATCAAASDQDHCVSADEGTCTYSGGCSKVVSTPPPPACSDLTSQIDLTYSDCNTHLNTCSVNLAGTACITAQATCAGYTDQANCRAKSDGALCKWDTGACADLGTLDCTNIKAASGLTYNVCQEFDSTCSVNTAGTACVTAAACSTYPVADCKKGTDADCHWNGSACFALQASCTGYSQTNCITTTGDVKCYWYATTPACIQITTASTDCVKVTAANGLTHTGCQAYNTSCTNNVAGSSCIEYKATCTGLTQANCSQSQAGKCFWYSNSCIAIASVSDCAKVTGSGLNFTSCQAYNTACAANAAGTACEAKSCTNKSSGPYTDSACSGYVSSCTSNSTANPTACISAPTSCGGFTTSDTCIRATEGACVWVAGVVANTGNCVKQTCSTAAISSDFNSHDECQAYLNTCTVARLGGCTSTGACSQYKTQFQCLAVGTCFWNARLNYGCVDKTCDKVENAYNTHTLCQGTNLGCTVKANNQGCMAIAANCSAYTISDQCHFTSAQKTCVWITADSGNTCQQMSCLTADSNHTTHESCFSYMSDESDLYSDMCTVAIVNLNGTPTAQGCQLLAACSSYTSDANCKIDNQGKDCVWNSNSSTCASKSCATAPATDDYNSNDECRAYLPDHSCTVDTSGSGCMIRPAKCDGMTQAQCVTNALGGNCEWFQEKCVDKACETAPSSATDAVGCNTYLAGCTMDPTIKCKTQICEDFVFTTDSDCQKAKAGCTSNGTNCVARTVCQAAVQAGCVTQSDGKQCQWVTATSTCVVKACSTAPATDDYATESQCASYFTGCTTKSGKGCTVKSTCAAANVDAACTTAVDGTKCVWDTNKCRNIDCQDYSGTTYAECQVKGANCTAGLNGKCIQLSNCEAVVTRSACVYGLNGPCLWISKYNNGAGACFAHNSCKSRTWNSDSQCKMISDQCTTNGSNCLAITSCAETNTSGGCKTGYDGNCIQTVPSLGSTDPAVCKIYNACTDAYYTTHADCQNASVKCTTNGTTSCAPLAACSSYTIEEACKINDKAGPTVDPTTGAVTVTGVCKWDTTTATASCRDQVCSDLTGLTHYACYVQLSTCTSDGTNCLNKGACSSYTTQAACDNGYGSDGPQGECFWEAASATNNNTANCRVMKCSDILNGTSTSVCQASLSSCVSDGTACIAQDKCSTYKTQTSCNSRGTDGICVFTASTAAGAVAGSGSCVLMSSCVSANTDSNACAQAKDRCSWTPASGSGTTAIASKCASHTCASFITINPTYGCTAFLSWDKSTQQVCTTVKGVCTETDPSTLASDSCYSISGYTYTWNTSTSKCSVCTTPATNNNTTTTTNTSNTTTDSGYILGLSSIILGYLMF